MKIRIGDKLVEAEMKDGVPVIKAKATRVERPDGTVDIIVDVPCIQLVGGIDGKPGI